MMKKTLTSALILIAIVFAAGCVHKNAPATTPDTEKIPEQSSDIQDVQAMSEVWVKELPIYLCDDVYQTMLTPTQGTGTITLASVEGYTISEAETSIKTTYMSTDCKIILCDDGCEPEAVVSRASQGYAPAYEVVLDQEYDTKQGWNHNTKKFKMVPPQQMLEDLKKQGVYQQVMKRLERQYYYLIAIDDIHYAYMSIEPTDMESTKPENEVDLINEIVKKAQINIIPDAKSKLYIKTAEYLEAEFVKTYRKYYDIQKLEILNWDENKDGNEATFFFKMTYQHYNRDPDTVDYIINKKETDYDSYLALYNDYLAQQESNYEFKVVLNNNEIELYNNISPKGYEWKPVKIQDFIIE